MAECDLCLIDKSEKEFTRRDTSTGLIESGYSVCNNCIEEDIAGLEKRLKNWAEATSPLYMNHLLKEKIEDNIINEVPLIYWELWAGQLQSIVNYISRKKYKGEEK